jgi:hypothetical protein
LVVVLLLALTGCGGSSQEREERQRDEAAFAVAQQEFEAVLPLLQDPDQQPGQALDQSVDQDATSSDALTMEFGTFREHTCIGTKTDTPRQTETFWGAKMYGDPSTDAEALAMVAQKVDILEAAGWTIDEDATEPPPVDDELFRPRRYVQASKSGLGITIEYIGLSEDLVTVWARSACVEHGEDHEMLRSSFDYDFEKLGPIQ